MDDLDAPLEAWPALADLLAASTLLFLILFAAISVPAISRAAKAEALRNTVIELDSILQKDSDNGRRYSVQRVGDYVLVRIAGNATFPFDRHELQYLRPEGKSILKSLGNSIIAARTDSLIDQIQVVGHTSREGLEERNWVLSASRAATVSLFLIDSVRIPACQIAAMGRSRYYPVKADGTEVDPLDRRIELEIRPIIPGDVSQEQRRQSCVAK